MKYKKFLNNIYPNLYFASISLFIFRKLLGRGYILAMDMIFTPNMNFENLNGYGLYSEIVRDWILHQSAKIVPADILQKIILFLIFYLSGISMFKLLKRFKLSTTSSIVGATFYAFNPFIYTRLIAGHWAYLIGYAILPYFYNLLINTFDVPFESLRVQSSGNLKNICKLIAIWIIVSMISIHHYALFAIVFVIFTGNKLILTKKSNKQQIFKKSLLIFIIVSVISLIWIPFNLITNSIQTFSSNQLQFFAPTPDMKFGTIFNLLAGYGFWAERTVGTMPKDTLNFWYIVFLILSSIALLPFLKRIHNLLKNRSQKQLSHNYLILLQIALIGIILSFGSFGVFRYIWILFYEKIPLLQPFRDTQKFLGLYMFVFGVALAFGVSNLETKICDFNNNFKLQNHLKMTSSVSLQFFFEKFKYFIAVITLALIFAYTHSLMTLDNELALSQYPDSWYKLEKISNKNDKILILPWKTYSFYYFVDGGKGKHIANPATSFFSAKVISNTTLAEFNNVSNWQTQLINNHINYVVLNKITDYKNYDVVDEIDNAILIYEDKYAMIYMVSN